MRKQEHVRLYCGISGKRWNYHPTAPGPYACISPVYGRTEERQSVNPAYVPPGTCIIQDSGAFSDGPTLRLSAEEALERQVVHAEQFGYTSQISHRASYDLLIDEKWEGGIRHKARWTEGDAEMAVRLTVKAAEYLSYHRDGKAAILSAQGVSAQQYLRCAERIVPYLEKGDLFGLGGWCITGKMPAQMMPVFRETMQLLIPFLAKEGVEDIHIWGVCYAQALQELLSLCQQYGISRLSTDSMGPSLRPCMGRWGYADWIDRTYSRPDVLSSCEEGRHSLCVRCRGLERARHVEATSTWLASLPPVEPPLPQKKRALYHQLSWLDEIGNIA